MTLEEAIEHCEERAKICDECGKEHDQLAEWLKEVQQYRKIGTVEYFEKLKLADNGTIWGLIDEYVDYKNIGTVEECREAAEKQKAKELVYESDSVFSNGFSHYRMGKCPMCDRYYNSSDEVNYCSKCGQALMNENLEGMEDE